MDASLLHGRFRRWMRLTLVVGLVSVALAGCGRNEEVVDDPSLEGVEELGDDTPEERSFEGDENIPFDRDDPSASQLDPEALADLVQDVFFGYDQFDLDAESRATLQENAQHLRDNDLSVLIEGHCDERGTAQYNMALGWKRANEVMRYLVSLGIDAARIETVSYGKERPFVAGAGEEAWAQNRRAHFEIRSSGQ